MSIRPVRNNNPGDLESGAEWMGLQPREKMTPAQAAEPRFAVFSEPKYGFRALAIVLLNYGKKHHLHTVAGIIGRWAPSNENNTAAYIKFVCGQIGKGPDAPLDLTNPKTLAALCKAIATDEAGGWHFTQKDLEDGVSLALRT